MANDTLVMTGVEFLLSMVESRWASRNGDSAAWEEFRLGRPRRTIDNIFADSDGTLWVGSSSGLLARVTPSSRAVRLYSAADGLENQDVFQVLIDSGRTLWVSTRGGFRCRP